MAAAGWRMRCTFAKETSIIGKFVQSFQAPLCKGSSAKGGEGLFFCNPPTAARFPNPSRRGLFESIRAAGAPLLFDLLSYLFSKKVSPGKTERDFFAFILFSYPRRPEYLSFLFLLRVRAAWKRYRHSRAQYSGHLLFPSCRCTQAPRLS